MESKHIGFTIKALRINRGLSLSELARKSGITKGNLHKIEAGANLTTDTLIKVSAALNETPSQVMLDASIRALKFLAENIPDHHNP